MLKPEYIALILPGLLEPPAGVEENLKIPALSKLLARATRYGGAAYCFEQALGEVLGCIDANSGNVPVAALQWPLHFKAQVSGCLRADPVHLQVDRDHARLIEGDALDISDAESRELLSALNAHFADEGMQFHMATARQWFVTANRTLDVDMSPPGYAAGRNVHRFFPTGDSGRYWKKLLTEIQMLLHTHPVNQYRQAQGQRAVNSLWLWGRGDVMASKQTGDGIARRTVYANDDLSSAMASHLQQQILPLPVAANDLRMDKPCIVADDTLLPLALYTQTTKWLAALARMESLYFEPILSALKASRIAGISVYPCNGQRIDLSCTDLKNSGESERLCKLIFVQQQQRFEPSCTQNSAKACTAR